MVIAVAMGMLFSLLQWQGFLSSWQTKITDNFFLESKPSPEIVIAGIDSATLEKLGRWPIRRTYYAEAIENLEKAGVKTIGIDILFSEPSVGDDDKVLSETLKKYDNVIQPVMVEFATKQKKGVYPQASKTIVPLVGESFSLGSGQYGHVNISPDQDKITRRVPLWVRNGNDTLASFDLQVLKNYNSARFDVFRPPTDTEGKMRINFAGSPGTFPLLSFADIVSGNFDASKVKDKMVLFGITDVGIPDMQPTPTSSAQPMFGVEIHANIIHTILTGQFLTEEKQSSALATIWIFVLLLGLLVPLLRPFVSLTLALGGSFLYIIMATGLFEFEGLIISVVWPVLSILFTYLAIILYRAIFEERKAKEIKGAFGKYVSSAVLQDILGHPEKLQLGGEKREMTVMFSDIRGFTTLSEKLKPEELVRLLNAYLDAMTKIVLANGGVLDKYIGDAIMAFWNAPIDQKNHEILACKTALEMTKSLAKFNEEFTRPQQLPEIKIGVGINTGEMIAGNMGSSLRFDYTVIGDAVNLSSRLEGTNKEYGTEIIISESVYGQVKSEFVCRQLDLIRVKGKVEPIMIYEVLGEKGEDFAFIQPFEAGLTLYRNNDFALAIKKFEEVLKIKPEDAPAKLLLSRCGEYIKNPPSPDWGGVYDRSSK